jgi:hypothetical protein
VNGDEAIHAGHCSRYACVYQDPACPVAVETLPGGRAAMAMRVLREEGMEDLAPLLGRRSKECAEKFGIESEYDPSCCRFPKSCSPYPHAEAIAAGNVTEADLEPFRPEPAITDAEPCQPLSPICGTCGFRHPVDTAPELSTEFAVRDRLRNWVYALPRTLPKALKDKRGSRETAEWQLEKLAGTNPEDRQWFEIVQRPVGPWQEVSD